eukprot:767633-Hanusia_phi.AAC.6
MKQNRGRKKERKKENNTEPTVDKGFWKLADGRGGQVGALAPLLDLGFPDPVYRLPHPVSSGDGSGCEEQDAVACAIEVGEEGPDPIAHSLKASCSLGVLVGREQDEVRALRPDVSLDHRPLHVRYHDLVVTLPEEQPEGYAGDFLPVARRLVPLQHHQLRRVASQLDRQGMELFGRRVADFGVIFEVALAVVSYLHDDVCKDVPHLELYLGFRAAPHQPVGYLAVPRRGRDLVAMPDKNHIACSAVHAKRIHPQLHHLLCP